MKAQELRRTFIDFFVNKYNHAEINGAPLVPENDPTVLFTTAGMHPLVPYLMGEKHPQGTRLVDCQKCVRTDDIEEVGDSTHLTFFEMLGNWSLGDYFKEEAIKMSYELLTTPLDEGGLGFDPEKLYVSCFAGDDDAPRDDEAADIWKKEMQAKGIDPEGRIFFFGKKENWWGPAGQTGPCGPDTEMFFDTGKPKCCDKCDPSCECGKFVEVWNDVFMQYNKNEDGSFTPLKQKNVDTGLGFERVLGIIEGKESPFETELFSKIMTKIANLQTFSDENHVTEETVNDFLNNLDEDKKISFRIIADHIRSATFISVDGISPSNTDQGYILRRLLRRVVRHGKKLGIEEDFLVELAKTVIETYQEVYPEVKDNELKVFNEFNQEEEQFKKTLNLGEKEFKKIVQGMEGKEKQEISGKQAFHLYDTYGFPIEMTEELASENDIKVDRKGFEEAYKKHQEMSRKGAEKKFSGGLADHSEEVKKLHSATHLLHQALRQVLGNHVEQKGSNITAERLRFDFSHPEKMTDEEKKKVEVLVNEQIEAALPVKCEEMSVDEAKKQDAIGLFQHKYGDKVKVYSMGDFSKEICGGPHVDNTAELKSFKIKKEESSSSGVRRIKAVIGV